MAEFNKETELVKIDKIIDYLNQLEVITKEFFYEKGDEINNINNTDITDFTTSKNSNDGWTGRGLTNPNIERDILKIKRNSLYV